MLHSSSAKGSGHFKVQVFGSDGNERHCEQGNMLLDTWLTMMNTAGTVRYQNMGCLVGTGTAVVLVTDTVMGNATNIKHQPSSKNDKAGYLDGNNIIYELINVFEFPLGAVVGNISEVGLTNMGSSSDLNQEIIARSLIKDVNGNPTTISVGTDDLLVITHTTKITVPFNTDVVSNVEFRSGQNTVVTGRFGDGYNTKFSEFCSAAYASAGWFRMRYGSGVIFGEAGVNISGGSSTSNAVNTTFTYLTLPSWGGVEMKALVPIGTWNYSDIRAITLPAGATNGAGFKWHFEPGLSKIITEIMELYFVRKFERDLT
ncbi:hypothetical protein [Shewanella sp. T24-MNA-CIBAN-0130]|uniref:hypothetical protein n=1 Tax=Shewanella sp. T24-MNA-CIBAN-0130 TaxID=3140470 RepID=UPI0033230040